MLSVFEQAEYVSVCGKYYFMDRLDSDSSNGCNRMIEQFFGYDGQIDVYDSMIIYGNYGLIYK